MTKYLILLIISLISFSSNIEAKSKKAKTDTITILPIDIYIEVVDGKKIVERNLELEQNVGEKVYDEIFSTLGSRYEISENEIKVESYQFHKNSSKSTKLPQGLKEKIHSSVGRYCLLVSIEAKHSIIQNNVTSNTLYVNPIIDNKIESYLYLIDKEKMQIIYTEKKISKADIRVYESIRRDIKDMIKKIYYKKTPNC